MEAMRKQTAELDVLQPDPATSAGWGLQEPTFVRVGVRSKVVDHASFYRRRGKRLLDMALGSLLLLGSLPLMLLVAVAVLITSGWPVLYTSERAGQGRRPFRLWKFRTMVRDADEVLERWQSSHPQLAAEYRSSFKLKDDPRVTALGRFLRKTSLDELPQLWNVLRGEMSLVGPRPVPLGELREKYGAMGDQVLTVRPGLTGLWQVNGRSNTSYAERVHYDCRYAGDVSLPLDLTILWRTLPAVLAGRGAE